MRRLIDKARMTLRYAAALALVGWYLMTPPQANGRFDISAPLSQWRIESGFASDEDCKNSLRALLSSARKEGRAEDIEAVKDARCVSMDDPRIKGD